jgi:hypothetical protein
MRIGDTPPKQLQGNLSLRAMQQSRIRITHRKSRGTSNGQSLILVLILVSTTLLRRSLAIEVGQ